MGVKLLVHQNRAQPCGKVIRAGARALPRGVDPELQQIWAIDQPALARLVAAAAPRAAPSCAAALAVATAELPQHALLQH